MLSDGKCEKTQDLSFPPVFRWSREQGAPRKMQASAEVMRELCSNSFSTSKLYCLPLVMLGAEHASGEH